MAKQTCEKCKYCVGVISNKQKICVMITGGKDVTKTYKEINHCRWFEP